MDDETFEQFASAVEWIELPANRLLVRQGDHGDSMYILISGRLQALIANTDGGKKVIGEVTKGESVGEMALFTGDPRSADILSIRDSLLVKISRETFDELVQKYPRSAINISKLIINRVNKRMTASKMKPPVVNIALLPLTGRVPIKEFSQRLVKSLKKFGKVLYLCPENISKISGIAHASKVTEGDSMHAQMTNWLDEQEYSFDFVVYEVGYEFDPWTRRSLRQADRLFMIGNFEDAGDPGVVENVWLKKEFPESATHHGLILLHQYDDRLPRYTRRWLRNRDVDRHYHVRWGQDRDIDRLARHISGNTLGLVLGGGGAKGFAHLGVFKALKEANIEFDYFAGTSMGAVFAAEMAMDRDYDLMFKQAKANFTRKNPFGDYFLLPTISLSRGKRLNQMLQKLYDGHDIEDLWTDFFCVSSNVQSARVEVLREGELWESIRCSLAIPGLVPPVIRENTMYIDGGALNNLPVDVMREDGIGRIVAVDLEGPEKKLNTKKLVTEKRAPRIIHTLWKSIILGSNRYQQENMAMSDYYLRPPVNEIGIINWKAFSKAVDLGYTYTLDRLEKDSPEWLKPSENKK